MRNSNVFICQLSEEHQTEIRMKLSEYFWDEGFTLFEVIESVENAMCDRLWTIEGLIDIKKYLV